MNEVVRTGGTWAHPVPLPGIPPWWRHVVLPTLWGVLVFWPSRLFGPGMWQASFGVGGLYFLGLLVSVVLGSLFGSVIWRAMGEAWVTGILAGGLTLLFTAVPAPSGLTLVNGALLFAVPGLVAVAYAKVPTAHRTGARVVVAVLVGLALVLLVAAPYTTLFEEIRADLAALTGGA